MSTAVIILNYNNSQDTINCIKSVEKYNTSEVKYIVVDNGSTKSNVVEEISCFLKETFSDTIILRENDVFPNGLPRMTYLISEKNDGYGEGNNKGLRLTYNDDSIDDVLILNSDILFVEDIIQKLKEKRNCLPDCAIISPVLYRKNLEGLDYNCARKSPTYKELILSNLFCEKDLFGILSRLKNERLLLKNIESSEEQTLKIDLPSGSCMLLSKQLMKKIGGFDSHTFLYYEENIIYEKLKIMNLSSYVDLKLKCIHLGATTTKSKTKSMLVKCSLNSLSYYFNAYRQPSTLQKLLFGFSMIPQRLKVTLLKIREKIS